MEHNFVACDCGNSSIRVLLCTEQDGRISLETVLQEPNGMIRIGEYDYWDMLRIFENLKEGVRRAAKRKHLDSIGICTWGVDFALFSAQGHMLGAPLSYRNTIGARQMERFSARELREMFFRTGILSDKINSNFMLSGIRERMPGLFGAADKLLLVPDILHYFFTGRMLCEPTELSTTQLLDVRAMALCPEQLAAAGVTGSLFPPMAEHGKPVGLLTPGVRAELGLDYDVPVVCVPCHDTASAVLGTPAPEEDFAFVSAGTWALVGLHRESPLVSEDIFRAGFTNEAGPFGRTTLLKNSVGLFVMQRLRAEYGAGLGRTAAWSELDEVTRRYAGPPLLFDVNAPDFFNPDSMSLAIWAWLTRTRQADGALSWPTVLSAAKASLAVSWADALERVQSAVKGRYKRLYVVGGGARDAQLCQLCADVCGMEIYACGEECACMGNALAQLACAKPQLSYAALREVAARSLSGAVYTPGTDCPPLLERYKSFQN